MMVFLFTVLMLFTVGLILITPMIRFKDDDDERDNDYVDWDNLP